MFWPLVPPKRRGATAAAPSLTRLRLPMGYIPDPQYAPLYVAADKGYFAAEGLEVEFDYSFETDGLALVGAGELPFSLAGGDQAILARAQGLPIVYIVEWFQKYPIAVVSKTAAGIAAPQDLVGRTVGLPGFFGTSYVGYVGLLSANDISQDQVEAVDIGFVQVESLLADQTDAVVVFVNNEPIQLANLGEDIQLIAVADYIDLVSNGLVTTRRPSPTIRSWWKGLCGRCCAAWLTQSPTLTRPMRSARSLLRAWMTAAEMYWKHRWIYGGRTRWV